LQQVRKQLKTQCLINDKALVNQPGANDQQQESAWTDIELLERSRYILCKMQAEWEDDEKEMMDHLFNKFPMLKTAYGLSQKLRVWYHGRNIGKNITTLENELNNWCDEVNKAKIAAFRAVRRMIEKHQDDILNYFKEGQTNAKAENMNGKIQRFLANNFGIRDRDFFLYRVATYFS